MTDSERFQALLKLPYDQIHISGGVGTLSEKYLHALLKCFFEENSDFHEVCIGKYTADICRDNSIIEIQTRSLDRLREKLEYYLLEGYNVTVVYPIPHTKWMFWLDEKSGEMSKKRKSPKKGSIFDSLYELYKIKYFLDWEGISIKLALLDIEEIKLLNGYGPNKKCRASRLDRIPVALYDIMTLDSIRDYTAFIPDGLDTLFTSAEYATAAGISRQTAWTSLNILSYLEIVKAVGKKGRQNLYKVLLNDQN